MLIFDPHHVFFSSAYIDPGNGYIFSSMLPAIIGFVVTIISTSFIFLWKRLLSLLKKRIIIIILLAGILIFFLFLMSKIINRTTSSRKVVIIGLDGLDPNILQEGIDKNTLPNFKFLKNNGYFSPLQTVVPPQSPVAWASFITGNQPSKHGVYDFIERDPKTYNLDLVFSINQKNMFKSEPFWSITSKNHIPTTVLFLPDTFYPSEIEGTMLSGMGVPDVTGTAGTFTLITSETKKLDPKWRGKLVTIPSRDKTTTYIPGPRYVFLQETKTAKVPINITKDKKNDSLIIEIQGEKISIKKNSFSEWKHITFSIDFFTKVNGIVKFYVKNVNPEIELYVSPINFDPEKPLHPISFPSNYSKEITKQYGLYSTLGLPHDTWALEENIYDEKAFLTEADNILNERKKIYFGELNKFKQGIFFGYFGITDTIQHMYWRFLNDESSPYKDTIINYYEKVDAIVGETMKHLDKEDTLIILSDHGFKSFDYEINLNTWLKDNGYLKLKPYTTTGAELLQDVDWSQTKAYAVGYNGIFINLKGREKNGIVSQLENNKLTDEISSKLLKFVNEETGEKVIKRIYTKKDLNIKNTDLYSPDIFVGYYKTMRSSWDTAIGATPENIIVKRTSKWSGDHLFDPSEVPGVLFINKKEAITNPHIIDIIPSMLHLFKIKKPDAMDGKILF